jgi:hypothetical protein
MWGIGEASSGLHREGQGEEEGKGEAKEEPSVMATPSTEHPRLE